MADYRILVTGSRTWADEAAVRAEVGAEIQKALTLSMRPVVVHGDARRGADAHAARLCADLGAAVLEEPHPADWDRHGKAAGYRRNEEMCRLSAMVCLVFPMPCQLARCAGTPPHVTHGTGHCALRARSLGIRVREVTSDNPLYEEG